MSLRVGTAVVDITPRVGGHLAGFAVRQAPSERVNDPLSARAVAVTDGDNISVIVALDLIALTLDQHRAWRERAARSTGIAASNIVVTATHTHGGPTVTPGALGDEPDDTYLQLLEQRIAEAVAEACSRLEPATISYGAGRCTDVASNRRQPGGPIDPMIPVITVCDIWGATKAVIFSFACHPVVLGADNLAITADWPGAARRRIERVLPGATAVYLQGCCGQLNTGHSPDASMTTAPQQRRTFAEAERIGERIAAEVLSVGGEQSTGPLKVAVAERAVPIEFRDPGPELGRDVDAWNAEIAAADPSRAAILAMWLQWAAARPGLVRNFPEATVAAHRWGDAFLSFLPGEPFVEMALDIRHATRLDRLLTAGYAGGVPGYVPYPPEAYLAGGYEVEAAHRFYGQPGVVVPAVGSRIFEAAVATVNAVSSDPG